MKEIIDVDSNNKLMSLIICGVKYGEDYYVIYSVKRNEKEDNIFVSKLVFSSMGYVISNDFHGGEKEVIDKVVNDILNKSHVNILSNNKIYLIKDVKLNGINKFSISRCYVTTVSRDLVKDVMFYYGLISLDDRMVVVREKDLSIFNKGSFSNFLLIIMGLVVLFVSVIVIFNVL